MTEMINPDYLPRNFVVSRIQRRARPNFAAFFSVLKIEDRFIFYKLLYLQYDMYYFILVT